MKETFISPTDLYFKIFIADRLASLLPDNRKNQPACVAFSATIATIESFVSTSKVLRKPIKFKCKEVFSSKKQSAKNYFFQALAYNWIVVKKRPAGNDDSDNAKEMRIIAAYEKLMPKIQLDFVTRLNREQAPIMTYSKLVWYHMFLRHRQKK